MAAARISTASNAHRVFRTLLVEVPSSVKELGWAFKKLDDETAQFYGRDSFKFEGQVVIPEGEIRGESHRPAVISRTISYIDPDYIEEKKK